MPKKPFRKTRNKKLSSGSAVVHYNNRNRRIFPKRTETELLFTETKRK